MDISVKVQTVKAALKALGDEHGRLGYNTWLYKERKPTDMVPINIDDLDIDGLAILQKEMKANEEEDTRKVTKLLNSLKNAASSKVSTLPDFEKMLRQYLADNGNPMLHSLIADLRGVAYQPMNVRYHPQERYKKACVEISLGYNTKMRYQVWTINIDQSDLRSSVPEILRTHNLMVPDESMSEDYVKILARFEEFGNMHAEQFYCRGDAPEVSADGDRWWWASRKEHLQMSYMGKPTKAVLDLEAFTDETSAKHTMFSEVYQKRVTIPTHPVLPLFSLKHHKLAWVNVVNMRKYKYEEDLKEKLVLPQSHLNLIGALVSNLDVLRIENEAEDRSKTIQSKANSSIILSKGPAGTGKTLTAEVYAEEIKRPLYEVQSGQIGVEPENIEINLNEVLNRSIRLKMPLLINEADVFIQERGRDVKQNAIVSVFLRLLEYHNGLVFLTTNRADDIDDAILSRCIAEIAYTIPRPTERLRLWEVMLKEFNVELPKGEVRKAVLLFPEVVGRDIQNLIRLTSRVCKANSVKFSLEALRENAVFRSIKSLSDKELEAEIEKRRAKSQQQEA